MQGQSALITGGTKGIGFSVARELAMRAYALVITYASDDDAAQKAREELLALGAKTIFLVKDDGQDYTKINSLVEILSEVGGIDLVIFNAGITDRSPLEGIDPVSWEKVFQVNLNYPLFVLQRLLQSIRPGGCILFTGSMMGVYPHSLSLAYGVSKAAVHALVKNLVKFLEPYGLRVCAIAPGFVDTDWQKDKPQEIRQSIESKLALHRFLSLDEVAKAYMYAIDNAYCNGEVIELTGGYNYR